MIAVFIEKNDLDQFFDWITLIERGNLFAKPVKFSFNIEDINDPLKVFLERDIYYLIKDAKDDLEEIYKTIGPVVVSSDIKIEANELQIVQDTLKKAERKYLSAEVVLYALNTLKEIPGLTATEALSIAEKDILLK